MGVKCEGVVWEGRGGEGRQKFGQQEGKLMSLLKKVSQEDSPKRRHESEEVKFVVRVGGQA